MRLHLALWLGVASATLFGASRPIAGQQLRGTVRDSASGLPIPGVVITLRDSASTAVARTLTNERGEYRVVLLRDAVRQLHLVRLGFRPEVVRVAPARDGAVELHVTMVAIPIALQPVQVTANANCPRRRDSDLALALLERARAGLLATVVARSDSPANMVRLRASRTLDGTSDRVLHQTVRIDSGRPRIGSFGAPRTAADFIRSGFTSDTLGLQAYHGPDAEVLLDEAFANLYCFRVMERERSRPNQVGLGFRPAAHRNGRVDIDGDIWIDTVAQSLVDIHFRYVGLDLRMDPFRPGGRVSFRAMPNGSVVIDRWSIRTVGVKDDTTDRAAYSARFVSDAVADARLFGVEVWGELARAAWPGGREWQGDLGTLRLRVVWRNNDPAPGTVVRLSDTDYEAMADSAGMLEIRDLLPGPYRVAIVDPQLAPLGLEFPTPLAFVAERDSVVEAQIATRTTREFVASRCEGGARTARLRTNDALLIGRVTTADGVPMPDARWSLRVSTGESGPMLSVVTNADVGSDGVFQYCQLQRNQTVELVVAHDGYVDARSLVPLSKPVTVLPVRMRPRRER
jgi:hypothetical protein